MEPKTLSRTVGDALPTLWPFERPHVPDNHLPHTIDMVEIQNHTKSTVFYLNTALQITPVYPRGNRDDAKIYVLANTQITSRLNKRHGQVCLSEVPIEMLDTEDVPHGLPSPLFSSEENAVCYKIIALAVKQKLSGGAPVLSVEIPMDADDIEVYISDKGIKFPIPVVKSETSSPRINVHNTTGGISKRTKLTKLTSKGWDLFHISDHEIVPLGVSTINLATAIHERAEVFSKRIDDAVEFACTKLKSSLVESEEVIRTLKTVIGDLKSEISTYKTAHRELMLQNTMAAQTDMIRSKVIEQKHKTARSALDSDVAASKQTATSLTAVASITTAVIGVITGVACLVGAAASSGAAALLAPIACLLSIF